MTVSQGLSEKTVATIHYILAAHAKVERAILFGSRAKGNYRPGSDIDLALSGPALEQQTVDRIYSELDDSFLPYEFSLILLSDEIDSKLRAHIDRVGLMFYQQAARAAAA
jgi:predicted nucleotidyltransferase